MAKTVTGTLSSVMQTYYEKQFLLRATENFIWDQMGKPGRVPEGEGKTVVWNRMTHLDQKTTALTEATDPTPDGMSASLVSATVAQYGHFESPSDLLELTALDTTIQEMIDVLAYQAVGTIDSVIKAAITSGGQQLIVTAAYSNSAGFTPTRNSINADDVMTVYDVRRAVRNLQGLYAKPHTKDRYVAIAHPDVVFDLEGDSNWVNAHIYTEKGINNVYNGEAGELYGTRWVRATNTPILTNSGSAGTEVYQTLVMGKEFFGTSKLQDLETFVDSPSKNSVLRLWSDIGWKSSFVSEVLNDSFCQSMESAASA